MGGKYGNVKTKLDGYVFDSKAEADRYQQLRLLQKAGQISELEVHPKFVLQWGFRDGMGKWRRAISYEADFQYWEGERFVVEDVKGKRTAVFNLKLKLFLYRYRNCDFRLISVY